MQTEKEWGTQQGLEVPGSVVQEEKRRMNHVLNTKIIKDFVLTTFSPSSECSSLTTNPMLKMMVTESENKW